MSSKSGKKITAGCLFVWQIWALTSAALAGPFAGGTGRVDDPYQIATAEQLLSIKSDPNLLDKHFVLTADIDLAETDPNAIAPIGGQGQPFAGVFDGAGHTINNLCCHFDNTYQYAGLFGHVGPAGEDPNSPVGEVRDLHLENVDVGASYTAGGLAGLNKGRIISCSVSGNVAGGNRVGGLVGHNWNGTVISCYADSHVSGVSDLGGLVGGHNAGCIVSSYATGSVSGEGVTGGLTGYNRQGTIITSYATARLIEDPYAGGLVGESDDGAVYLSFWDIETSGTDISQGGQGQTTAQLQAPETFRGWGAETQWTLAAGVDTPRLAWEQRPGEVIQDAAPPYTIGTGDPNDPYQIWTAVDLTAIGWHRGHWGKHFVLMADIDANAVDADEVLSIGLRGFPFSGLFDGQGHTIWDFTYQLERADYAALFGAVGPDASMVDGLIGEIRNLHLADANVVGHGYVGGMVAHNEGLIVGCSIQGHVEGTSDFIGGLVASNHGDVISCLADCYVSGDDYIGGLVGYHGTGRILTSAAWGDVRGNEDAGGLAGSNGGTIAQCYATGDVSYGDGVGGLVSLNDGIITECYSVGHLQGDEGKTGGLAVRGSADDVMYSFWDIETSGCTESTGGVGLTTEAMQTAQTYLDAGWDFVSTWTIHEGSDYPRLQWE